MLVQPTASRHNPHKLDSYNLHNNNNNTKYRVIFITCSIQTKESRQMNSDAKKNCTWIQTVYVYVLSQCRKILFDTVTCFIFPFPFFHFESLLRVLGVLGLKNQVELFLFPRFSARAERTVPFAQVTKSTTSGCGTTSLRRVVPL